MKKIYFSFLIISVAVSSAFGQTTFSSGIKSVPVNNQIIVKSGISALGTDTLVPPSFGSPVLCDSAPKLYSWQAPATGYVFGNNSYGEIECAEKYYATGSVNEVLVWHGYVTGATGNTTVKIYSINPTTKGPSATVLGTSAAVITGSISTTAFTSYAFSPAVAVTSNFAAAVVFPVTTGDTVVVVSTAIGCSTPDSLSWLNFPAFGGWRSTPSIISGHPNADLYIIPIGTFATGVNEYSANGLSLLGAFPNPASDFTNISYRLNEPSNVSVKVFDLTGRVIEKSSENLSAGNHNIKVSLKNLSAGNYYYTIKTEKAQLTSKFVVIK